MAARAIVTRYGTESVLTNGNFSIQWWAIVIDPATYPVQQGCLCTGLVELDAASPGTWTSAVESAVIAEAAAQASPFTLTAGTVFVPTIA